MKPSFLDVLNTRQNRSSRREAAYRKESESRINALRRGLISA
jgi:hypothetical protein